MRFVAMIWLAAVIFGLSIGSAGADGRIIIQGVHYLSFEPDAHFETGNIVIEGDRIVGVSADAVSPGDGVEVIQGAGRYLIPGLTEMHGHIPPMTGPADDRNDILFLYVARGVTTVRGMLGAPGQLDLKRQVAEGEIIGPTLYLAGPSFRGATVSSPEQARQMVSDEVAEGWDLLKIHPGLTIEEFDAVAAEAKARGIAFAGHTTADAGIAHVLEAGQRTIDHLDGYLERYDGFERELTPDELREAVRMTREAGAGVVPTQALWRRLIGLGGRSEYDSFEELAYMPPATVASWRNRFQQPESEEDRATAQLVSDNRDRLLAAMSEGGVEILAGSDAPQLYSVPGFSLLREAEAMADAGMAPAAVLESATRAPGRYFADKDRYGEIKPGMRADLILLDADPLADIANLWQQAGVLAAGHWYEKSEIDARLAAIRDRHQ